MGMPRALVHRPPIALWFDLLAGSGRPCSSDDTFSAHFDACIFYFAGSAYDGDDGNWIDNYCPSDDSIEGGAGDCLAEKRNYSKYVSAIYWAFVTMTTVGYGDISPAVTDGATVAITIMSQVMGTTLLAYVLGTLIMIVPNLNPAQLTKARPQSASLRTPRGDSSFNRLQREGQATPRLAPKPEAQVRLLPS